MPRSHSWACDWCVPIQKKEARPLLQDLLRENKTTPAPIDQPCPTNLFMGIIEARGPSEQGWEIWRQWRWTFRAETSGELKDVSQGGLGPHHGGAQEFWRNPLICSQPEQEPALGPLPHRGGVSPPFSSPVGPALQEPLSLHWREEAMGLTLCWQGSGDLMEI